MAARRPVVLFLQDLLVPRREIRRLLADRLPGSKAVFPGDPDPAPNSVVALVTVNAGVGKALLALYPAVRVVSVAFSGVDAVDLAACRARRVEVTNVPGYATEGTAEMAVALALAVLREVPSADRTVREGGWNDARVGEELAGKTVGIVGTGRIGTRAATLFSAFGCPVLGWSRSKERAFARLGRYVSWERLWRESDVVSLHVPLTERTRGLVSRREFAWMKRGTVLVNVARGAVVDAKALLAALRSGRIRAGLDVFDVEPLPAKSPLRRAPNAVLSPHVGYRTREALSRRARAAVENVVRLLAGSPRAKSAHGPRQPRSGGAVRDAQ